MTRYIHTAVVAVALGKNFLRSWHPGYNERMNHELARESHSVKGASQGPGPEVIANSIRRWNQFLSLPHREWNVSLASWCWDCPCNYLWATASGQQWQVVDSVRSLSLTLYKRWGRQRGPPITAALVRGDPPAARSQSCECVLGFLTVTGVWVQHHCGKGGRVLWDRLILYLQWKVTGCPSDESC